MAMEWKKKVFVSISILIVIVIIEIVIIEIILIVIVIIGINQWVTKSRVMMVRYLYLNPNNKKIDIPNKIKENIMKDQVI